MVPAGQHQECVFSSGSYKEDTKSFLFLNTISWYHYISRHENLWYVQWSNTCKKIIFRDPFTLLKTYNCVICLLLIKIIKNISKNIRFHCYVKCVITLNIWVCRVPSTKVGQEKRRWPGTLEFVLITFWWFSARLQSVSLQLMHWGYHSTDSCHHSEIIFSQNGYVVATHKPQTMTKLFTWFNFPCSCHEGMQLRPWTNNCILPRMYIELQWANCTIMQLYLYYLWPLLLTWINFNPCMDKYLHPL